MRPTRFHQYVHELAKQSPAAGSVRTLAEAGDTQHPSGLVVTLEGREARWQFVAQSAPGDKYSETEVPVEGDPMAPLEVQGSPEAWLAALLSSSGHREIADIDRWSEREDPNTRRDGLTVIFHSGAKIYARAL